MTQTRRTEVLNSVKRAMSRSAIVVHGEMNRGLSRYLTAKLEDFDVEMENASLQLIAA